MTALLGVSRTLCRRVPVLGLGSRGSGGDQESSHLCAQAIAKSSQSVRNAFAMRPQAFASVAHTWQSRNRGSWSRNAELSSPLDLLLSSRFKDVNSPRDCGVVVAKCRTVVAFGHGSGLHVSKLLTVTGIGGCLLRNAELSSLLEVALVLASQTRQQSQGSGGPPRCEAQNSPCFWSLLSREEERRRQETRGEEIIGDRRGEGTEKRGERTGGRGERTESGGERGEDREWRGEGRVEERGKSGEGEERGDRRGERREARGERREERRG